MNKKTVDSFGEIVGWYINIYTPKIVEDLIETKGEKIEIVQSTSEDAFPDDGKKDGYYYVKIDLNTNQSK